MAMIELRNVYKSFNDAQGSHPHRVLRGVNLKVSAGEGMVVIGGSGTGKSAILKHIIGLIALKLKSATGFLGLTSLVLALHNQK